MQGRGDDRDVANGIAKSGEGDWNKYKWPGNDAKDLEEGREWRETRGIKKEQKKRYCHFWNNGRCRYSEAKCGYLHKDCPHCARGNKCKMELCMYYHTKK